MATTMKGLLKGLRYITQIFDEEEREEEMQIGLPTDVKHVAHIGSDGPATNTPSWMNDFKPQEHENGQAGLKEPLPPTTNEKSKQKTRRKSGPDASPNHNRSSSSGNAVSSEEPAKQSRHNRSKHGSMDSSNDQEPSVRRRRSGGTSTAKDREASSNHLLPDGSAPPRKPTSRPRKLKGLIGGDASMKKSSKGKPPESSSNDII